MSDVRPDRGDAGVNDVVNVNVVNAVHEGAVHGGAVHEGAMDASATMALREAIDGVSVKLRSHAGGLELVDIHDGQVEVRFTGMCCGCPWKAVTWTKTVQPALLAVPGVSAVGTAGVRISDEAAARLQYYTELALRR